MVYCTRDIFAIHCNDEVANVEYTFLKRGLEGLLAELDCEVSGNQVNMNDIFYHNHPLSTPNPPLCTAWAGVERGCL